MSGSCKVKRTNRNFNTDTVKHVRRDNGDDEDLQLSLVPSAKNSKFSEKAL